MIRLVATLAVAWMLAVPVSADVPGVMERSGTSEMLSSLTEQFIAGFEQAIPKTGTDADNIFADLGATVSEQFPSKALIADVTAALESELTRREVRQLDRWYETPLALRITQLEIDSADPLMAERIAASIDSLLADETRVSLARRIDRVAQATDSMVELAQTTQEAMVDAMASHLSEADRAEAKSVMADALQSNRPELERIMLASFVATYESLSDQELSTYAEFLDQPAARKFYDVVKREISKEMAGVSEHVARIVAERLTSHLQGLQSSG